jgi:hypothetical protein
MVAVEDLCMWLEIFYQHENIYLYQDEPLVRYRVLDESISRRKVKGEQDAKMYLCLFDFILRHDLTEMLPEIKASICRSHISSKIWI